MIRHHAAQQDHASSEPRESAKGRGVGMTGDLKGEFGRVGYFFNAVRADHRRFSGPTAVVFWAAIVFSGWTAYSAEYSGCSFHVFSDHPVDGGDCDGAVSVRMWRWWGLTERWFWAMPRRWKEPGLDEPSRLRWMVKPKKDAREWEPLYIKGISGGEDNWDFVGVLNLKWPE
jgi:hypothetical protein